jgi:hypothetical protein
MVLDEFEPCSPRRPGLAAVAVLLLGSQVAEGRERDGHFLSAFVVAQWGNSATPAAEGTRKGT